MVQVCEGVMKPMESKLMGLSRWQDELVLDKELEEMDAKMQNDNETMDYAGHGDVTYGTIEEVGIAQVR